jgi:REP element-mobilizing transposase RayT
MANTYTQISIQAIFAVKGRENIITRNWRDQLHKYIAGIIRKESALLAVGGWSDHVHIFAGLPPTISVAEFVQKVKSNSSKWINQQNFVKGKFQWQAGYGAFSYSRNQRDGVIKYIMRQQEHHKIKTFKEEYQEFLEKFEVIYKPEYLFEYYD